MSLRKGDVVELHNGSIFIIRAVNANEKSLISPVVLVNNTPGPWESFNGDDYWWTFPMHCKVIAHIEEEPHVAEG